MSIREEIQYIIIKLLNDEDFDILNIEDATSAIIEIIRKGDKPLLEALKLVLPMAKGYAYKNNVGSNMKYIETAEKAITEFEKMLEEDIR